MNKVAYISLVRVSYPLQSSMSFIRVNRDRARVAFLSCLLGQGYGSALLTIKNAPRVHGFGIFSGAALVKGTCSAKYVRFHDGS